MAKCYAAATAAPTSYRKQIDQGLAGDEREALKARVSRANRSGEKSAWWMMRTAD
jgi:hypothetical protein